jgi:predicted transcriptional regulator
MDRCSRQTRPVRYTKLKEYRDEPPLPIIIVTVVRRSRDGFNRISCPNAFCSKTLYGIVKHCIGTVVPVQRDAVTTIMVMDMDTLKIS